MIYRKFGLIYRQFMLNINIDVCDMLAGSAANASALAKMLNVHRRRQFGNMHDPCPITVGNIGHIFAGSFSFDLYLILG